MRRFLLACDQFQPHQIHISIGLGSGQSLVFAVRDPVRRPEKGYSAGLPLYVMETLVDAGAAEKRVLITQPLLGNPRTRSFSLYEQLHNAFVGAELRQSIPYRDGGSLASLEPHVSVAMTCRPTDFQRTSPDLAGLFLIDNAPLAPAALISASPKVGEEVELEWLQFQFLTTLEWVRGRPEVTLSEGARRIFEAAVDDLCAYSPVAPQLLLKLGLNFTALDCSKVLSAAHAQASVSVLRHSLAVAQELHGGPSDSFVKQHLMAGIQRRGELTATEIHDVLGRNIDCDTIHRVLASLVHEGRLHMVKGPSTGGARPTLWREGPRPFPHRQSD